MRLSEYSPVNTHVWHAFYMNCRKMYEFFVYGPHNDYLRACQFVVPSVSVQPEFGHWTRAVQNHMSSHLLHLGGDRVTKVVTWDGRMTICIFKI
jgi:hypothetical protein